MACPPAPSRPGIPNKLEYKKEVTWDILTENHILAPGIIGADQPWGKR